MIRAGGEAAQLRLDRELAEAKLKRENAQQRNHEKSALQKKFSRIADSNAFGKLSILMISAFSILLAFADPTEPLDSPRNSSVKLGENVFTVLFTIELVIVWVAAGPLDFFRGGWNVFDFFVVGVGWLSFSDLGDRFPLACIRVARYASTALRAAAASSPPLTARAPVCARRLLRPLRSLARIEGLKRLVDCLVESLPGIANVGGMIVAFIFIMSLFGLKMFVGLMRFRCVDVEEVLHYNETLSLEMPCDNCVAHGLVCAEVGNPNFGFSSFDSLPAGALLVFQVLTLEGWTELMDVLLDVSNDALVGVFFGVVVCVGAYFLTNYLLAQVCLIFTSKLKVAKQLSDMKEADDRKLASLIGALGGGKQSKKQKPPKFTMELVQARGLRRMDLVNSDPYLMVQCGQVSHRSRTVRSTLEPVWKETVQFPMPPGSEAKEFVTIQMFDEDFGSKDSAMGSVHIEVRDYSQDKEQDHVWDDWYALKPMVGCKDPIGEIRLKISWNMQDVKRRQPRTADEIGKCEKFIESDAVGRFINLCIVANFVLLAVDYHGMPEETASTLEVVNVILTWIFTVEFVIKLPVLGATKFWKEPFNRLDAFVVLSSQVELWMAWLGGGDGGAFSGLRSFRLLRILRSLKLINQNASLRDMMKTTAGSMTAIRDFAILLILMLYIYALTGLTLFGGQMHTEDGDVPRTNFDNLLWSFATVFVVMTRENWQAVLFDAMSSAGAASCFYFITLVILTNYILLALFIGTLLENFEKFFLQGAVEDAEKAKAEHQLKLDELVAGAANKESPNKDEQSGDDMAKGARATGRLLLDAAPGAKMFVDGKEQPMQEPTLSYEEKLAFVRSVPLLQGLRATAHPNLCKMLRPVRFQDGQVVMRDGEITDDDAGMFFLLSGSANVSKNGTVVKTLASGDYVGELALSTPGGVRAATVTVTEESTMLRMQRRDYIDVLASDEHIAKALEEQAAAYVEIRRKFDSTFRTKAQDVVFHRLFEMLVLIAIMLSSGALAIEHPNDDPESAKIKVLKVLDVMFVVFFTFEMAIKMVAMGFWGEGGDKGDGYFRSGWNWLDFVIVISALAVMITGAEGGVFRAIRAVRILRPLRAIQQSKGMRTTVAALLGSVPAILTVAGCIIFFCSIVAILCTQLFKGTMFACSAGEDWNPALKMWEQHIWVRTACIGSTVVDGEMTMTAWESADQNFDNFLNSMLTLFEIFALEAWPDIMINLVDATDVNHGPSRNNQPSVIFLMVLLILLGSFFLLNLFVGVIVTAYNEAQRIESEANPEEEEVSHTDALQLVMECKPIRVFHTDNFLQQRFVLFTRHPKFEISIMACILLNVLVMCVDWEGIDDDTVAITGVINSIFMWIFTAECAVKLVALDKHYFFDAWNVFDFVVVAASLIESLSSVDFNPTLVRIFRVFRLARLLKLTRNAKGIQALVATFEATLPSLVHVGLLLLIFFFMYAVLGVQLFCNVQRGETLTRHADFSSFGSSLFTLFRLTTGENWNVVMHELMVQPPYCTPAEEAEDGISDCGNPLAAWIYMLSFTLLCAMTTLNLIIAVILYAFFDMSEESLLEPDQVMKLRREHFDSYVDAWTNFDPEGVGQIVADSKNWVTLAKLINQLPKPLGVDSVEEAAEVAKEILSQTGDARKSRLPTENLPMLRAVWEQVDQDHDDSLGRPEVRARIHCSPPRSLSVCLHVHLRLICHRVWSLSALMPVHTHTHNTAWTDVATRRCMTCW